MNRLFSLKLIVLVIVSVLFVSCGTKKVVLKPEKEVDRAYYEAKNAHNEAVVRFTQILSKYNLWCSNPEYREACSKVDETWLEANKALDTWGFLVESRKPSSGANDDYKAQLKALKTKLLMEIPNYSW